MPTEQQIADIIRAMQAAFGDSAKSENSEEAVEEIVETPADVVEEIVETPEEVVEEIVETPESINDAVKITEKLIVLDEKLDELRNIIVKMTTPPSVPYVIDNYEYSEKTVEMPADEKLRAATQTIMRGY